MSGCKRALVKATLTTVEEAENWSAKFTDMYRGVKIVAKKIVGTTVEILMEATGQVLSNVFFLIKDSLPQRSQSSCSYRPA